MVKQNQLVGGSVTGQTAPELLALSFAGRFLQKRWGMSLFLNEDDTLKKIVESDLVYLLVLAVLLYSKQLQIAFSGTSY